MAAEGNITLQASTTATTTAVTGTVYNTLTGTPRRGMRTRWIYSGAQAATSGVVSCIGKIQMSADNSNWVDRAIGEPIALTTAAAAGEFFIPITVTRDYPYIRTVMTQSASSGGPTIVYQVDFVQSQP